MLAMKLGDPGGGNIFSATCKTPTIPNEEKKISPIAQPYVN